MKKFFSIGELKISLEFDSEGYEIFLDKALEAFSVVPFEIPDIRFQVDTTSPFPSLDAYRRIFTSNPQGLWTIFEDIEASHYLISLQNIERNKTPYKIVKADRKFREFLIYTRPVGRRVLSPFEYPLADLAVSGYLNINKAGIILHSACISWRGKGYLFSGVSGSGKSTISEIWQKDGEAEVLTDERVIIREYNHELWAFGTPWHGTAEIHKNAGVPVENIFFINHGRQNSVVPISKKDAVTRLMVRCFPTFWNREGMEFALDFCARVAGEKKCYNFQFLPDQSAAGFIKKFDQAKHIRLEKSLHN